MLEAALEVNQTPMRRVAKRAAKLIDHGHADRRKAKLAEGVDEVECEEPEHGDLRAVGDARGSVGDDDVADGEQSETESLLGEA